MRETRLQMIAPDIESALAVATDVLRQKALVAALECAMNQLVATPIQAQTMAALTHGAINDELVAAAATEAQQLDDAYLDMSDRRKTAKLAASRVARFASALVYACQGTTEGAAEALYEAAHAVSIDARSTLLAPCRTVLGLPIN
jgi:hypothetical protein